MKTTRARGHGGDGDSIAAARLVSPARRRAWERELVGFQLDELNALYDGLACARNPEDRRPLIARARARIDPIVRAAEWIRGPIAQAVRAAIQAGFDRPEDAFAPALLLTALGPGGHDGVEDWLGALPHDVVRILADLGYDPRPGGQARDRR